MPVWIGGTDCESCLQKCQEYCELRNTGQHGDVWNFFQSLSTDKWKTKDLADGTHGIMMVNVWENLWIMGIAYIIFFFFLIFLPLVKILVETFTAIHELMHESIHEYINESNHESNHVYPRIYPLVYPRVYPRIYIKQSIPFLGFLTSAALRHDL